jgi:hypothetical protein
MCVRPRVHGADIENSGDWRCETSHRDVAMYRVEGVGMGDVGYRSVAELLQSQESGEDGSPV